MTKNFYAIYCDDIRHEVGNKQSLIGVYNGVLKVTSFPAVLPKLCIFFTAISPASDPFIEMTIRLYKDKDAIIELPISGQNLSSPPLNGDVKKDKDKVIVYKTGFAISPFPLDGPCTLRVRAYADGKEYKAGALTIESDQTLP